MQSMTEALENQVKSKVTIKVKFVGLVDLPVLAVMQCSFTFFSQFYTWVQTFKLSKYEILVMVLR